MNDSIHISTLQRPTTSDCDAWKAYWREQNQPWRTEPEIDKQRQVYLNERRCISPDMQQSIYPFKDIKLSRADVEWLLATHEGGRGPVDWNDKTQRARVGLDLRGADLRNVDLHDLPLARTYAGSRWITAPDGWLHTSPEQQNMARAHLEGANLKGTHLEGADLTRTYLRGAYIVNTHLEDAKLNGARLEGAYLIDAHFEDANLTWIHLEGALLSGVYFDRAILRGAFFDTATSFENISLGEKKLGFTSLSDIRWGGVDLSFIDWGSVHMLGDELEARQWKMNEGKKLEKGLANDKKQQLEKYQVAVRANRQLATELQAQGLNEEAARFAYRAQCLQRKVLWLQGIRSFARYLFSLSLDLLAGYGYKLWRSFLAYLVIILSFMGLYMLTAHFVASHLSWDEALILSMSSFHGRGFFTQGISLGDPYARITVIEGFVGLFVEVTLIATFTQRFFRK